MIEIWNLFLAFLKVGMMSFGGAYSLLPIIENEVVKSNTWLTPDEFMKVLGIVEIIPGAISIKFATYTGFKIAGIPGVIAANLGNLFFPAGLMLIVFYTISHFEKNPIVIKAFEGVKYAVAGMIIVIMVQYLTKSTFNLKFLIFALIGGVLVFLKVSPVFIILISALIAILLL
ncbi:MAG: chrA [Ignavibacteria bacterium]|nr:chrA [Ignavibacteria bacterium]